jgi:hypothetical protein
MVFDTVGVVGGDVALSLSSVKVGCCVLERVTFVS